MHKVSTFVKVTLALPVTFSSLFLPSVLFFFSHEHTWSHRVPQWLLSPSLVRSPLPLRLFLPPTAAVSHSLSDFPSFLSISPISPVPSSLPPLACMLRRCL